MLRAAEALDTTAAGRTASMTADDVHSAVFRKRKPGAGRGYDEDQVDALLDLIEKFLRVGGAGSGSLVLDGRPLQP